MQFPELFRIERIGLNRAISHWMFTFLILGFLNGCGSYSDFTLPVLPPAQPKELSAHFDAEPVLERGSAHDVLNPSVVRKGSIYYNFYSEFDGKRWATARATSTDGHVWSKQGRVLSPDPATWEGDYIAANGSALLENGELWYWYQAGDHDRPSIGLARSADGRAWRKEPKPVLEPGPRGSWDERGVGDPYVLKLQGEFYVYYLGQNRARQQQIGLARSHDGVHWTKLRSSPVLTIPWPGTGWPDDNGLGEPAVWQSDGWYWMLFTGRSEHEQRSLIAARSGDGVHWQQQTAFFSGREQWDREVVCDATVLVEDGRIRFWFGGGDKPRPDENLDGQIGEGVLEIVSPRRVQ
jgi:predicted GH43/DUF377 family glycosyl hydrolase